jgi:hypothetical protein
VVCHHSCLDHGHYHTRWDVETSSETVTDSDAQTKYYQAQLEASIIQSKKWINNSKSEIQQHEENIGKLCIQFPDVALSGSFAGHIASAIRLLEVRLATMKSGGTDQGSIGTMEDRIVGLQHMLDIVEQAHQASSTSNGAAPTNSVSKSGVITVNTTPVEKYYQMIGTAAH